MNRIQAADLLGKLVARSVWLALFLLGFLTAIQAHAANVDSRRYYVSAKLAYERLDYERSVAQLQKALVKAEGVEDELHAYLLLGTVNADWGQRDKALDAFVSAFALDPDAPLPEGSAPKIVRLADEARKKVRKLSLGGDYRPSSGKTPTLASATQADQTCANADAPIRTVWTKEARHLLERKLVESNRPRIVSSTPAILKRLDAWVDDWADVSLLSCLKSLNTATDDVCLSLGRDSFAALIQNLSQSIPEDEVIFSVTGKLPRPQDCSYRRHLSESPTVGTDSVTQAREQLAKVAALIETRRVRDGMAPAENALAAAKKSGNILLQIEALMMLGRTRVAQPDLAGAREAYTQAAELAVRAKRFRHAVRAYALLVYFESETPKTFARAKSAYAKAQALLRKMESPPDLEASTLLEWGSALCRTNHNQEGVRIFQKALTIFDRLDPSVLVSNDRARTYSNLAVCLRRQGHDAESELYFERAADETLRAFGPKYWRLTEYWPNLAAVAYEHGNTTRSKELAFKSIELGRELKMEEGQVTDAYAGAALVLAREGDLEQSRRLINQSRTWAEKNLEAGNFNRLFPCMTDGVVYRFEKNFDKALETHRECLAAARAAKNDFFADLIELDIGIDLATAGQMTALKPTVRWCDGLKRATREQKNTCAFFRLAFAGHSERGLVDAQKLKKQVSSASCSTPECGDLRNLLNRWIAENALASKKMD